jgi:transcriptional antiterminator RfaH
MWLAVKTKPSQEKWAAQNVQQQGCAYYLPLYGQPVQARGKVQELRVKSLFPSYLFVNTEGRSHQWRWLLGTWGISSVMLRGDIPAIVPDREIEKLRAREGEDGLIILPDCSQLQIGQKVRVRYGPFESRMGVYQGQTAQARQRVLLDFLGGKVMALITADALEAV